MELTAFPPKLKSRRFKPLSEIVRTAKGKPIGRVLRLELERRTVAYDYTRLIGTFATEKAAIKAVRAKHEARR
jgi:hypothetical protein